MLIGVWNSQDRAISRKVTWIACGRPGIVESSARQLVRPDGWIVPMPSQVVKLSSTHADQRDQPEDDEERAAPAARANSATAAAARVRYVGGGAVCGIGGATAVIYR